ncbi:hypothetical protein LEP1GSC150_2629 [Leptospira interrogans serovar Copenhageni str. LT2050]|uniref:Uncharacterized protein n=1 Tax=Leptospira interrogans serovar Copenhageni str. LT2050 TaxID=1001598 RepID=M3HIE3_LEPIT|nr:hypothetical protein LEP1GSC150_2629 [Leptospira interrogans serovar Copenhageni str. LT2050]
MFRKNLSMESGPSSSREDSKILGISNLFSEQSTKVKTRLCTIR